MPLPTITYLPISDTTHIEFYPGSIKHSKLSDDENLRFDYDLNKRLLVITIESTPALVKRYGYDIHYKEWRSGERAANVTPGTHNCRVQWTLVAVIRPYPRSKRQPCWKLDYFKKMIRKYLFSINKRMAENILKQKEVELSMVQYRILDDINSL